MGSMFRSDEMSLCQLFVQPEAIFSTVAELGEIGIAQFKDLNPELTAYQRKYISEVRRIDEMERRLDVIKRELTRDHIDIPEAEEEPRHPSSREMINLEALIEKNETEISELAVNYSQLLENRRFLIEHQSVLQRAELFFSEDTVALMSDGDEDNRQLQFIAGVVDQERFYSFERMLWRVSHGNIFVKQARVEEVLQDSMSHKEHNKIAFIVFFQGDQLKVKVKKICDGFRATIFPYFKDAEQQSEMLSGLKANIADLELVINKTKDHRRRVLNAAGRYFYEWSVKLKKLKAIYHTMNLFSIDVSHQCLVGECWIPVRDIDEFQAALESGARSANSSPPAFINVIGTDEEPPTYQRTNKFTSGFQNLIDAYGIASYREANPGVYTIVTFPFLFAVMYGDMGHGFILFLIGLWMVLSEKKLAKIKDEIFGLFFGGRYIIMMMGIFSLYTGFIYNDIFAKSMNVFGSSWRINYNISTIFEDVNVKLQLNPTSDDLMPDRTYPIGIDPVWQVADNKILFLNSYKMKLSIVFGVAHMIFGVCMSVVNYNHFRRRASILLEFLPQIIFLLLLFGYLVFMMFFKWIRFNPKSEQPYSPGCAPSVLVYFINMMLFTKDKALYGCNVYMFPGQKIVQTCFVIIAVLCIPWMLCGKPIHIMMARKKLRQFVIDVHLDVGEPSFERLSNGVEHEEPMSEIWTHQAIHTIEYILGTISHTASYLRLWALSLAHAQLSEVLWTKLMTIGFFPIPYIGPLMIFHIFYMWASLTFAVLIIIEGLSAFLHTLRLHWVEFMSKFYEGSGQRFEPFSFKIILSGDD